MGPSSAGTRVGSVGGTALTLKGWFQLYQLKKALKGGGTSGSEQGVIITPPKKVAPSVLFTTNLLIPRGPQVPPALQDSCPGHTTTAAFPLDTTPTQHDVLSI